MISIVIPVFNEKDNIAVQIETIAQEITAPKELLIVYDFDEDNTVPVVRELQGRYPFSIALVKNTIGRGALNAIKTGMRAASGDAVLVTMADLSDDLRIVDAMYGKLAEEGYDLVCGSRYMSGGKQIGGPFLKGLFSRCAGVSLHFLTGIPTHDISNSFKMYRKAMLDKITLESTGGFEIGMEITVKAFLAGYRITELPSTWYDRSGGESHFKMWEWIPHYLHWYFLCIRRTWFRGM